MSDNSSIFLFSNPLKKKEMVVCTSLHTTELVMPLQVFCSADHLTDNIEGDN
jgi:hypothetical protein